MCGKSQSSLIILVMIAILIIFIWIFSLFWNQASQARTLASERISKLGKYLDIIKGISRNSLIFSSHMSTQKVAGAVYTYYHNVEDPPDLDQIKGELSTEGLGLLNKYTQNTKFKEAVFDYDLEKLKYACMDFPIDEGELDAGKYDEKFPVGSYGSSIEITYGDDKVSSDNSIFETISRNRFFFLYRKFRDWTNAAFPTLQEEVGTCIKEELCTDDCFYTAPNCKDGTYEVGDCAGFDQCLKDLLNKKLDILNSMISDQYVECSFTITCGVVQMKEESPQCWGDEVCVWPKPLKCNEVNLYDKSGDICASDISLSPSASSIVEYKVLRFGQDVIAASYCVGKNALKVTYSCIDKKYDLSVPAPARNLEFAVDVQYSLQRRCK